MIAPLLLLFAAETDTATAAASGPSDSDRIAEIEGELAGYAETIPAIQAIVDKLDRIKISSYVQGRFEYHQDSLARGLTPSGRPGATTQFLVRRARLKSAIKGRYAEAMVQIDAAGRGSILRDAEASLIEPFSGYDWKLTIGQFKWPFGYEVLQSSSLREMPERSRAVRALFPGERDRGIRLAGAYRRLRLQAAVVNGNGIEDSLYASNDQNVFKDVVGRLGFDFDQLVFGVSGYFGKALITTAGDPNVYERVTKSRLGADVQLYLDVPALGGLALKGEAIFAEELGAEAFGFWVLAVQNLTEGLALVVRYDHFDKNLDEENDAINTIGGGFQYYFSGNLRAAAIYEHPAATAEDPGDDVFTLQLQAMF